jgi:hypothetical protein
MLPFKLKADRVVFQIGKIREALDHAHHKEHCGVDPERNTGITLFNLDQRCPADGGTLSRDAHGNAPPPPGVSDVVAQFAQRMPDGDGQYH